MSISIILNEIKQVQKEICTEMKERGLILLTPEQTFTLARASKNEWDAFAQEWDNLTLDKYMADGGKYRLRRYSSFDYDGDKKALELRSPEAYVQSYAINSLNGGVERVFEPCTTTFLMSPVLHNLLCGIAESFSDITSINQWNIKLHPYRILASPAVNGKPAPEGRHRDGVTYIMTMMIHKYNVSGGESRIYDIDGTQIFHHILHDRGELLIGNDMTTTHSVTPIEPLDATGGYRDVLVIAFTKHA